MVSHLEWVRQKRACATSTRFSNCSLSQKPSSSWVRWGSCRTNFSTAIQEMDTLPQAIPGGTRPTGVSGAHNKIWSDFLLCYSWFRLQSMAIHCNRRWDVDRCTLHIIFLMRIARVWHITWLKASQGSSVCMHASPHLHAIHDERLSVCSSLFLRSDSLRVSLLHLALLFPLLPVLWPELLLPCGQRQGKDYSLAEFIPLALKANGQCSKRDNCSFRHDMNKRAKSTQPNPSPKSSTQQNVKNASRTKSPRGKSPSGKMARLPCKDYLKGTCTTPFCENGILQSLFYKSEKWMHIWWKVLFCTPPGWRTALQEV